MVFLCWTIVFFFFIRNPKAYYLNVDFWNKITVKASLCLFSTFWHTSLLIQSVTPVLISSVYSFLIPSSHQFGEEGGQREGGGWRERACVTVYSWDYLFMST